MGVFIYLTPSVPLSFKGEGEGSFIREAKPLLDSPLVSLSNFPKIGLRLSLIHGIKLSPLIMRITSW